MGTIELIRINQSNYLHYDELVQLRLNGRHEDRVLNEHQYSQLDRHDFFVFVAQCDGKNVGWIQAIVIPKLGAWSKNVLYVDELWVMPEYRRKGIGKRLCNQMNHIAKQIDVDRVRLYTENPAAQKLYENTGLKNKGYCVFMESDAL